MKKSVEDGRCSGGCCERYEGCVVAWMGDLVSVFKIVIKGEPGVGELAKLKSVGLDGKGTSLSVPNIGAKSLLTMASLSMWGGEMVRFSGSPQRANA